MHYALSLGDKNAIIKSMENTSDTFFDVIVVGAGPSGVAAAITAARAGKKVVLIERGDFAGAKNMIGGAVFLNALRDIFPDCWQDAPFERFINKHHWSLLSDKSSVDIGFDSPEKAHSASIFRSKFDVWLVEKAKEAGVYFVPSTPVRSLIVKDDTVTGIKTDIEEIFAPVTIVADGVNSLLAKQLGLKDEYEPKDIVLSVKETIKLSKEIIEERFNLPKGSNNGAARNFIGGLSEDNKAPFAMGFMYTFKDSVSIGLGVNLEDLGTMKLNPSELLDKLKSHPVVKPLINGGELLEYSAHLIPEGGYNKLPKLYANGAIICGDAAGFVNAIHFEGTNFAFTSGKLAAQTALLALDIKDYSKKTLCLYKKKLEQCFVLKDLKSYRNLMSNLYKRSDSLMMYYPKKAAEFFEIFSGALGEPKRESFRSYIKGFFNSRSLSEIFEDAKAFISSAFGVLK